MFCGFCEDYCPTGAMTMTDFYELADTNREGLIYPGYRLTKHPSIQGRRDIDCYHLIQLFVRMIDYIDL